MLSVHCENINTIKILASSRVVGAHSRVDRLVRNAGAELGCVLVRFRCAVPERANRSNNVKKSKSRSWGSQKNWLLNWYHRKIDCAMLSKTPYVPFGKMTLEWWAIVRWYLLKHIRMIAIRARKTGNRLFIWQVIYHRSEWRERDSIKWRDNWFNSIHTFHVSRLALKKKTVLFLLLLDIWCHSHSPEHVDPRRCLPIHGSVRTHRHFPVSQMLWDQNLMVKCEKSLKYEQQLPRTWGTDRTVHSLRWDCVLKRTFIIKRHSSPISGSITYSGRIRLSSLVSNRDSRRSHHSVCQEWSIFDRHQSSRCFRTVKRAN